MRVSVDEPPAEIAITTRSADGGGSRSLDANSATALIPCFRSLAAKTCPAKFDEPIPSIRICNNVNFISNIQYGGFSGFVRCVSPNSKVSFNGGSMRNCRGASVVTSSTDSTELTFRNFTWDGLTTFTGYSQSTTMTAFQSDGCSLKIVNCTMQNLFGSSILNGVQELRVDGLDYKSMNGNPVFDIS